MKEIRILGIDPGTHLGVCSIGWDGAQRRCQAREIDLSDLRSAIRLGVLFDALTSEFRERPDLMVVEAYAYMRQAVGSFTLAEYGGIIRLLSVMYRVPFVVVNPVHVKMFALGTIKDASKIRIAFAVQRHFGLETTGDNAADAAVLAHVGLGIRARGFLAEAPPWNVTEYQAGLIERYAPKVEDKHTRYQGDCCIERGEVTRESFGPKPRVRSTRNRSGA